MPEVQNGLLAFCTNLSYQNPLKFINGIWCAWTGPFMTLYQVGFVIDQYGGSKFIYFIYNFLVIFCENLWFRFKKKKTALSMLHEAKIAYYAFDAAILFATSIGPAFAKATWRHCLSHFIDRVAARTCCAVNVLTSRISFFSRDLGGWGPWSSIIC